MISHPGNTDSARMDDSCSCGAGSRRGLPSRTTAFTLIELILVMSILMVIMGVVAPSLSQFFRGRTLDSEARRLLTLTRYAQSRAVSEGVPMLLWLDPERRTYGLEAEHSYTTTDERSLEYQMAEGLELQVGKQLNSSLQTASANAARRFGPKSSVLLFQVDGFVSEISPQEFWIRELPRNGSSTANLGEVWMAQTRNGLGYEIQPATPIARR